jgi:PTS system mannose-specific IIA component
MTADPDRARVGVVLIGHGETASRLLDAARGIVGAGRLDDVRAVDAGAGRDVELDRLVCDAVEGADAGTGVVVLVDLLGSSPCACGQAEAVSHRGTVVTGLNLAMLCKLATIKRVGSTAEDVASLLAEAGRRAIVLQAPAEGDGR